MKAFFVVLALGASVSLCVVAAAEDPTAATAATAPAFTTTDTAIGDLLDNPKARAVLDKYVPGFTTNEQVDAARTMTLRGIQQFAPETFTDEVLAKIDADLAKVPL